MKFEHLEVMNLEGAMRGMRNPKDSWHLSDSLFGAYDAEQGDAIFEYVNSIIPYPDEEDDEARDAFDDVFLYYEHNGTTYLGDDIVSYHILGQKDLKLAQTLIKSGPVHSKFLRQILVSIDITAPLYWWKEFDTYKVATVANSCSTMHKLADTPISLDMFWTTLPQPIPFW